MLKIIEDTDYYRIYDLNGQRYEVSWDYVTGNNLGGHNYWNTPALLERITDGMVQPVAGIDLDPEDDWDAFFEAAEQAIWDEPKDPIQVSCRIRQYREQSGLTQTELAKWVGVSRPTVARWESGELLPGLESLVRAARLFKVSLDDLVAVEPARDRRHLPKPYPENYYG